MLDVGCGTGESPEEGARGATRKHETNEADRMAPELGKGGHPRAYCFKTFKGLK